MPYDVVGPVDELPERLRQVGFAISPVELWRTKAEDDGILGEEQRLVNRLTFARANQSRHGAEDRRGPEAFDDSSDILLILKMVNVPSDLCHFGTIAHRRDCNSPTAAAAQPEITDEFLHRYCHFSFAL